jgi:hypothetical protein
MMYLFKMYPYLIRAAGQGHNFYDGKVLLPPDDFIFGYGILAFNGVLYAALIFMQRPLHKGKVGFFDLPLLKFIHHFFLNRLSFGINNQP